MVSQKAALATVAALLWAAGLYCVWREVAIISPPQYDIDGAGRVFLLNGALAIGIVLVPAAFIIRDWLRGGRRWQGMFEVPMLWAFGVIYLLVLNVVSEIASPWLDYPRDSLFEGAIYVLAHFHYALRLSAVFALFSAIFFWVPKISGRMYSTLLARTQFGLQFAGANCALLPLWFMEFNRATPDFRFLDRWWDHLRILTGIGAVLGACGMLVFAALVIEAFVHKRSTAAATRGT